MVIAKRILLKLRQLNLFINVKTQNKQDEQVIRDQVLSTRWRIHAGFRQVNLSKSIKCSKFYEQSF